MTRKDVYDRHVDFLCSADEETVTDHWINGKGIFKYCCDYGCLTMVRGERSRRRIWEDSPVIDQLRKDKSIPASLYGLLRKLRGATKSRAAAVLKRFAVWQRRFDKALNRKPPRTWRKAT